MTRQAAMGSAAEIAASPRLAIGALSRATGIPVETLRTWENRYGFPAAERKPSGHRVYPVTAVPRLRRIAEALTRGHRAGEVVGASDAELASLLQLSNVLPAEPVVPLGLVEQMDADGLARWLVAEWARLGPVVCLERAVGPLTQAVGEAWAAGRLGVRHEHFMTEKLASMLTALRVPFEERARGPLVVYTTLPGERHALGLLMAALTLTAAGLRCLYAGPDLPIDQAAGMARERGAHAVAVSVSAATRGRKSVAALRKLRTLLPARVALLVGGRGAPEAWPGIESCSDLRATDDWGRAQLATGG